MKKLTFSLLAFLLLAQVSCYSQNPPLRGSGKIVQKIFSLTGFDAIEFLDMDGVMEVEAGKPFSIIASIDDNLLPLLEVRVAGKRLLVKLKGNFSNRLYVEETNIHIKISLPQVLSVFHRSNGNLAVSGIQGNTFKIKNTGNGNTNLKGSIDELEIICRGNGTVNARDMKVKTLQVRRSGNGNVYAKADKIIQSESNGNGEFIHKK